MAKILTETSLIFTGGYTRERIERSHPGGSAERPEMKLRYTVALALPLKPCQCPGCLNLGRMRLQRRRKCTIRSLYLCDGCLESLLPIDLNDLFVEFGAILKTKRGFHNTQAAAIVRSCSKPANRKVKLEIRLTI